MLPLFIIIGRLAAALFSTKSFPNSWLRGSKCFCQKSFPYSKQLLSQTRLLMKTQLLSMKSWIFLKNFLRKRAWCGNRDWYGNSFWLDWVTLFTWNYDIFGFTIQPEFMRYLNAFQLSLFLLWLMANHMAILDLGEAFNKAIIYCPSSFWLQPRPSLRY